VSSESRLRLLCINNLETATKFDCRVCPPQTCWNVSNIIDTVVPSSPFELRMAQRRVCWCHDGFSGSCDAFVFPTTTLRDFQYAFILSTSLPERIGTEATPSPAYRKPCSANSPKCLRIVHDCIATQGHLIERLTWRGCNPAIQDGC